MVAIDTMPLKGLQTSFSDDQYEVGRLMMSRRACAARNHWTASPVAKNDFNMFLAFWWNIVAR